MFQDKRELIKQENWALRCYSPLGYQAVREVKSKWTSEGYELSFEGGSGMIAHFEGRIVALTWQSKVDVPFIQLTLLSEHEDAKQVTINQNRNNNDTTNNQ